MAAIHHAPRKDYSGVVLCAPVTVPYRRYSTQSAHWWIGRALKGLLDATKLRQQDIDGFLASSFTLFPDTAIGLTQHYGLSPRWLDHIPMGGASGILALRKAARAVQAGDCEFAACIAGDTNHVDSFRKSLSTFSRFAQDAVFPYGAGGPNASFALIQRNYMRTYGAERADFGKLAVAQRANALNNPQALMKKPLTLAEYLNARMIADPIGLYDCVMPCAGAEAFLVTREESAKSLGLPYARLLSTIERHNAYADDPLQHRGGWGVDIAELYGMAGAKPADVSFVQTYDDYPVISMMQLEDLGLCKKGEARDFVRANTFTFDGTCPHNVSGGQLSAGQAGCAGGFLGLVEAIRQVTGRADGRQVKSARLGLVSGFGMITYDRGLASGAALIGPPDMAKAFDPPPRKNPLKRTRLPTLPAESRSRQAHLLTRAAAEGRFGLPACLECGKLHYPPRDCCPKCLSPRIGFRECSSGGVLAAATEVQVSNSNYFRERAPWRTGMVLLDAGPGVAAHAHQDCAEGARARLEWRLDKAGNAAAFALPETPSPAMLDSPEAREMSLDPKHRRILVTDARSPLGLAVAEALAGAGASVIFAGIAEPWKPFAGRDALAAIKSAETVPLDITNGESVRELAASIGARVDIILNTSAHIRPGGLMDRQGAAVAREELETGYLGLLRLAQAFGPVMKFRGADGVNSACAIVNVISVYAQMPLQGFGAWSASQAALHAASLSLRAELRGAGVRVVNIFSGPTEDEWFQLLPPPKVSHAQIASAVTDALRRGLEDVYCGDAAQDFRARLEMNPKALERELGQ